MLNDQQLTAAARTVEHLAIYLRELKGQAAQLRQTIAARDRGYFTPTEEESVRALFVSYLQTRAALLELVLTMYEETANSDQQHGDAFLIGFAGAVLLVDAATHVVESYADSNAIVRKLNEADQVFRIEADTYDAIRKSLTDPLNVWRLYQARRYFDENESELRKLATLNGLAAIMQVIDDLGHRVRFTAREYAEARARVRTDQVVGAMTRLAVHKLLYGLQEMLSRMASELSVAPRHQPGLPDEIRDQLVDLLRPGDVLVTRKEYAITNYFLPGYWPHAALYLGDIQSLAAQGFDQHQQVQPRWLELCALDGREPRRVLEALKDGVWVRSLQCPLSSDAIAVIRPQMDADDVLLSLARGFAHEGKPYDFDFDFTRSDRMVCTEVVYRAYEGVGGIGFSLTRRAGRLTLSAEDLLSMALRGEHFSLIAVFAPGHVDELQTGQGATQLLEHTMAVTK